MEIATGGEYTALKAECERLRADNEALRDVIHYQFEELFNQLARIAQLQAILDDRRTSLHTISAPLS
jgi:hypothetical protein